MLNKPKYMSPSTNLQECVIDANADEILFSCIVDGNESISAWQIIIYNLNDNSVMIDTNKILLPSPFFPIDNKNRNVVFERNLKDYITEDFINSKSPYYWTISFWSTTDKDNINPTTTSCEEVFYANSTVTPVIQYSSDNISFYDLAEDIVLDSSKYYFKAIYSQKEGVGLKRFGWRLKDVNNDRVLIDTITNNQVYGLQDNILCFYDGFLNDDKYSIEVYIETQNGATITTSPINFSVIYEITFLSNDFKVSALNKEGAIVLDWTEATIIGGRENGAIDYKFQYPIIDYSTEAPNTSVAIPKNSSVIFDTNTSSNLDIPESSYMVISTQLANNDGRVLFSAEGVDENGYELMRQLIFNGSNFVYTIIGSDGIPKTLKTNQTYSPNQYKWYIITMSPFLGENGEDTWFDVIESNATHGIYPSENFYPRDDTNIYPTFGTWDKLKDGDS